MFQMWPYQGYMHITDVKLPHLSARKNAYTQDPVSLGWVYDIRTFPCSRWLTQLDREIEKLGDGGSYNYRISSIFQHVSRDTIFATGLGSLERLQHIQDPFLTAKDVGGVMQCREITVQWMQCWDRVVETT